MNSSFRKLHVITNYFYPVRAGIETNVLETYSLLRKKGYSVLVHTSKDTLSRKNSLTNRDLINGLQIYRYTFYRFFGFYPKHALMYQKDSIISIHGFEVFPYVWLLILLWFKIKIQQIPYTIFITPHGTLSPDFAYYPMWQRLIRRILYTWPTIPIINSIATGIRAVSVWEKEMLIKKGVKESLIEVISNGLQKEAFIKPDAHVDAKIKKAVKTYGEYIVQVGRIATVKNYETTIKALRHIPDHVNFVIVGPVQDNIYKKQLLSLIEQLKLGKRVFFAGTVTGVNKYYILKNAKLMVHMSAWESFCNAVYEGMSQGLVCIVGANSALPYLIKNGLNGYCLPTYDVLGVARKISYVLDNKNVKFINKIRKTNQLTSKKYTWTHAANKMDYFYKNYAI